LTRGTRDPGRPPVALNGRGVHFLALQAGRRRPVALHEIEVNLLAEGDIRPQLGHVDLPGGDEAPGRVDGRDGHVEEERRTRLAKGGPLVGRLEVVDRLHGLDLDDALHAPGRLCRGEHEVGKMDGLSDLQRGAALVADVGVDQEAALPLLLQQADYPVVLELFANGSDEDGHAASGARW
jgi:hypothetical protein